MSQRSSSSVNVVVSKPSNASKLNKTTVSTDNKDSTNEVLVDIFTPRKLSSQELNIPSGSIVYSEDRVITYTETEYAAEVGVLAQSVKTKLQGAKKPKLK